MKKVYYVAVVLFVLVGFSSCDYESLDNEVEASENKIDSNLYISSIDKEDAETVGTRE